MAFPLLSRKIGSGKHVNEYNQSPYHKSPLDNYFIDGDKRTKDYQK